jgi:hypothetical protein
LLFRALPLAALSVPVLALDSLDHVAAALLKLGDVVGMIGIRMYTLSQFLELLQNPGTG